MAFDQLHEQNAIPTVEITTRFKAPSSLGEEILLRLECSRLGRTSMELNIDAACREESRFEARSTLVFVDSSSRPTGWPEHVLKNPDKQWIGEK